MGRVNPVPRTYVHGFGALPSRGVQNIHPRAHARGVLWYGVNKQDTVSLHELTVSSPATTDTPAMLPPYPRNRHFLTYGMVEDLSGQR